MSLSPADLPLQLSPVSAGAQQVRSARGQVLGQIKWIDGRWKFKALWLDEEGDWVPGGGPLTAHHNKTLDSDCLKQWQRVLTGGCGSDEPSDVPIARQSDGQSDGNPSTRG